MIDPTYSSSTLRTPSRLHRHATLDHCKRMSISGQWYAPSPRLDRLNPRQCISRTLLQGKETRETSPAWRQKSRWRLTTENNFALHTSSSLASRERLDPGKKKLGCSRHTEPKLPWYRLAVWSSTWPYQISHELCLRLLDAILSFGLKWQPYTSIRMLSPKRPSILSKQLIY